MTFELVDRDWGKKLDISLNQDPKTIDIVCPFIQKAAVQRFVAKGKARTIRVLTRFNLRDFGEGVSDPDALRLLLEYGAAIRGVRHLHTKLYIVGRTALITSANLTAAALSRNHEFGCISDDTSVLARCQSYFDGLWDRAKPNLTQHKIDRWDEKLAKYLASSPTRPDQSALGDEGADVGLNEDSTFAFPAAQDSNLGFVKLFGKGTDRAELSMAVIDEIDRCGSHWACAYPKGKRPQNVRDGAIMFLARITKDPNDIRIFGRAIGMAHVPGRDDATDAEVAERSWKDAWPHYVRLHHAEFVAGTLANGVSLNELMGALGANSFRSTQANAERGRGNTNPRLAYQRQASVALTSQAIEWLTKKFAFALDRFGRIQSSELKRLDWPIAKPLKPIGTLSKEGKRLLDALLEVIDDPEIDIESARTFPTYKQILTRLGIEPKRGHAVGVQFERAGGVELNDWLFASGLPAITGLVVRSAGRRPGKRYFEMNKQKDGDLRWWLGQVCWASVFNWASVLKR